MIKITSAVQTDIRGMSGYFSGPWPRYRKRPVVVEAIRMPEEFCVETLEGEMRGEAGDYLIRGVKGEMYPCRKDIFEETYEEACE